MKNTLLVTILFLVFISPFAVRDGKKYRIILTTIFVLLPFYQGFIYLRYMIFVFTLIMIRQESNKNLFQYTKEPINRSMALFFIISLVSSIFSSDISRTVTPIIDLMFFYAFFLVCSLSLRRQLLQPLFPTIILFCLISSIFIQIMQLYGVEEFYIYDENSLNQNTGLSYSNEDRVIRYWGPFGNALTFSSYLAILGIYLFIYYHNDLRKRIQFLSYIILFITFYGIALTAGRTALASMFLGLFFYIYIKNWKKAVLFSAVLFFVTICTYSIFEQFISSSHTGVYSRFINFANDKNYRSELWLKSLPVLLKNPFFGTGPGNLTIQIAPLIKSIYTYQKDALSLPWGHIENTYLSVLYTFGLTGFGCFIYMLYKSFSYGLKSIKESLNYRHRQIAYSLSTAWIVIAINMIANPVFVTDYRLISLMLIFVSMSIQISWKPRSKQIKRVRPVTMNETHIPLPSLYHEQNPIDI